MPPATDHLPRVRLSREAYLTLNEWQVRALKATGSKPTYSQLLDQVLAAAQVGDIDVWSRPMHGASHPAKDAQ